MKDSDSILWDKLRGGDKNAFDEIFYKFITILFNYGKRYTHNDRLVEDCIQDLFTELWVKRYKLGSTTQIKPYLLVSIKRRILRQLSKERKNLNFDQISEFHLEYSVEDKIIQESNITGNINLLNRTLEKLTPKQKEVIHLKFFEQLSYAEIAHIMKVDVKAIYKLMARAIGSIKSDFISFFFFFI